LLLARGLPASAVASWHHAQHDPSATVVPPTLVGVYHDGRRDGRWDTAHDLYSAGPHLWWWCAVHRVRRLV